MSKTAPRMPRPPLARPPPSPATITGASQKTGSVTQTMIARMARMKRTAKLQGPASLHSFGALTTDASARCMSVMGTRTVQMGLMKRAVC